MENIILVALASSIKMKKFVDSYIYHKVQWAWEAYLWLHLRYMYVVIILQNYLEYGKMNCPSM